MAIFKCKMCGGQLEVSAESTTCECEYCGTTQTLPKLDSDKKANLYDRANHFRRNNDYDKAMSIYEQILNEDAADAEAYWSLVLCKYGIEYVEDPGTHKRVPTVNRAQYTSIYADENYKAAVEHADVVQKSIYEQEAKAIDEIQKGILAISEKEEPFDVFICYKESDENGRRTQDSVLANDLYHQLTQEGFKVFFARITLEDKLGQEYEPYIFAALNSSKVMVVLGTKPEYFNAVWVKNEWSRYLGLISGGAKKMLIPAYRDMDPYDLPEEFSHLQAQDMNKLGFMQDLIRGIKKIAGADEPKAQETVVVQQNVGGTNADAQIMRGNMALEDKEWQDANAFFEEALNLDPKCAEAYIGKFLAEQKASNLDAFVAAYKGEYEYAEEETLDACEEETEHIAQSVKENIIDNYVSENQISELYEFDRTYKSVLWDREKQKESGMAQMLENKLYIRAKQFASGELQQKLDAVINDIQTFFDTNIQNAKKQNEENIERIKAEYEKHIQEADEKTREIHQQGLDKRENDYQNYIKQFEKAKTIETVQQVQGKFRLIRDYKTSEEYVNKCNQKIEEIKTEEARIEEEKERQLAEEARLAAEKRKATIKKVAIACAAIVFVIIAGVIGKNVYDSNQYNKALSLVKTEKYEDAKKIFASMKSYKKSEKMLAKCETGIIYNKAQKLFNEKKYIKAQAAFTKIFKYKDSSDMITKCGELHKEDDYNHAMSLFEAQKYDEAKAIFAKLSQYKNSIDMQAQCVYKNPKVEDILTFANEEWKVLKIEKDSILVIRKNALAEKEYNSKNINVTWETCSLRRWLNNEYLQAKFSKEEQAKIKLTKIENHNNRNNNTPGGKATSDKIFLLSVEEVNALFRTDEKRICRYTPSVTCVWWLRSPGNSKNKATCVNGDGTIYGDGINVNQDRVAVRPALWLNLES